MTVPYLRSAPWSSWSRDERYFCSLLYGEARTEPERLARFIDEQTDVRLNDGPWDLGFEVCFYRDYLWQLKPYGTSFRSFLALNGVDEVPSLKRTFDLCLFGNSQVVIIEAKVCEGFTRSQNGEFENDKKWLSRLPGLEGVDVKLIGLASKRYIEGRGPVDKAGDREALKVFDGVISWRALADKYRDTSVAPLLQQADDMYRMSPGQFLPAPS